MRALNTTATCAILLLGTALPALAQKQDSFDYTVSDIRVLENKRVQSDVGITQSQRDRMNKFAKDHEQRLLAYQQSLKGVKPTADKKAEVQKKIFQYLQQLKQNVLNVLTPTQLKRLREITLQGYGWTAVADARVGGRIGMSSSQIQKVKSIISAATKRAATIEQNAAEPVLAPYKDKKPKDQAEAEKWNSDVQAKLKQVGNQIKPQLEAIRAQTIKDIQAVLTAKQRAAYTALQGKKFKT